VLAGRRRRLSRGRALHDVDLGRHCCRVVFSLIPVSTLVVAVWLVMEEDGGELVFIEEI
jgi:hypothetical protein